MELGRRGHNIGSTKSRAQTVPLTPNERAKAHQESLFEGDHGDRTQLFDDSDEDYGYGNDDDSAYDSSVSDWDGNEDNSTDDDDTQGVDRTTNENSQSKGDVDKQTPSKRPLKQYFLNGEYFQFVIYYY